MLSDQVGALGDDTAHVTMTVGGNDLGYADVITECALPWWISDCYGAVDGAEDILEGPLPGRYDSVFGAIGDVGLHPTKLRHLVVEPDPKRLPTEASKHRRDANSLVRQCLWNNHCA